MPRLKNLNAWAETHVWTFALILTVALSPLIIWASWDTISAANSGALRVLLGVGIVLITYVGLGVLLLWNRWTQRKYREKGITK